jgi:hypothetical protein
MKVIDWRNFDGPRFQKLGNSLLFLEVLKFAHLYSAPGKDGGIDQYFNGTFKEKAGKWRFQDKFKSVEKNKALSALKIDISNDITDHYQYENYLVFIINGSIGKTRLSIEFVQQVIDKDDEWIALLLKPSGFSAASFNNLLNTNRKLIILADDQHGSEELFDWQNP